MTNILFHNYYYRAKSKRQIVKSLVGVDDLISAETLLDNAIVEHDNFMNVNNIVNNGTTFTSNDNLSLHHAKVHLDAFQKSDMPSQKTAVVRALDEVY